MNLPNKLTTLRVIMIPFFVFFPFFVGEGNKKTQGSTTSVRRCAPLHALIIGEIARKNQRR